MRILAHANTHARTHTHLSPVNDAAFFRLIWSGDMYEARGKKIQEAHEAAATATAQGHQRCRRRTTLNCHVQKLALMA